MNHQPHVNRPRLMGSRAEQVRIAAGQPFATDAMGRPIPNLRIQQEADAYNAAHGLPPIAHDESIDVDQARARRIADAYEALLIDDLPNPTVRRAYEAFAREVSAQWDFALAHGMTFEPEPNGEDPYKTSFEVADDVRNNRHLYFYQGGEPHGFMSAVDPNTGFSINDKFRAVHDYFGHCAGGHGFGPHGEESAWNSHSQMFSWDARRALTTETRGQNSWVNFGRQNYDRHGEYLNIPPARRPYAKQKTALLPDEFVRRPSLVRHVERRVSRRQTRSMSVCRRPLVAGTQVRGRRPRRRIGWASSEEGFRHRASRKAGITDPRLDRALL
jgi:hypothetical protein